MDPHKALILHQRLREIFLENVDTHPELAEQKTGAGPSGQSALQIPKIWILGTKYNFAKGWVT